ncbi:MAG: hypothetical protein Q7R35_04805 [Elusimicrobiota bacterium]|nr:hypothetical protein [Elusimicrobiota bacterium]
MPLYLLLLVVFLFNLPFGYLRSKTVTFSVPWLLYVHLPVPFVLALRIFSGFGWRAVPLLILADVAGQLAGGKLGALKLH